MEDIILNILKVMVMTIVTYIILLLLTKMLGKKQLGELKFFHYITGITIGTLAANLTTATFPRFFYELTALIVWCLVTLIISYITSHSNALKDKLGGNATFVIFKGKVFKEALEELRLNVTDLMMLLREQNIFTIKEVDYALFESNGRLSVYKHRDIKNGYLPTLVVSKGLIVENNLVELGLSKKWVLEKLKEAGVSNISDVYYAMLLEDGSFDIDYF